MDATGKPEKIPVNPQTPLRLKLQDSEPLKARDANAGGAPHPERDHAHRESAPPTDVKTGVLSVLFVCIALAFAGAVGYYLFEQFREVQKERAASLAAFGSAESLPLPGDEQPGVKKPAPEVVLKTAPLPATKAAPKTLQGPPPPPPPPPQTKPVEALPAGPVPIMGAQIPLGKVAVAVENFWLEAEPPGATAFAALTAHITNISNAAIPLPTLEVSLEDADGRAYKPFKAKLPASSGAVNPMIKQRATWAFQVPTGLQIHFAVFQGKDVTPTKIAVYARSPENEELVKSAEYAPVLTEVASFASPREATRLQYEDAKTKLGAVADELNDADKRLAKLEKKLKAADSAVDSALKNLEKYANAFASAKARIEELQRNRSDFRHGARVQETQLARAEADLTRAQRSAADAEEVVKEKHVARKKVLDEMKEEQNGLKSLKTKLDMQQKVVEDFEKKMAQ
jgi:predicted  nucleic acid-binding Zn-ribbon protein